MQILGRSKIKDKKDGPSLNVRKTKKQSVPWISKKIKFFIARIFPVYYVFSRLRSSTLWIICECGLLRFTAQPPDSSIHLIIQ